MSTVPHTLEAVHFSPQTVFCGDCLEILPHFPANSVDLIYIDPPFNSNRNYEVFWGDTQEKRAFDDRFGDAMAYIDYMRPRVEHLHRVLKSTGSFYYHCDWHASHYIKVMLDEIFGANNFKTEVVWRRQNAKGLAFNSFPNDHDIIFYYTKSSTFTWNRVFGNLSESYVADKYKNVEPETGRRYQLDNLLAPTRDRPNMDYEFLGIRRVWRWSKERMQKAYEAGLVVQPKPGSVPRLKRYLDESKGQPIDSLWMDIPPINSQAKERLGYPTQKPLALLERIIKASSNPGDVVLDAFCGCGTTLVAAQQLGRKWVGIDISPTSVNVMGQRLEEVCGMQQAPPLMSAREVEDSFDALRRGGAPSPPAQSDQQSGGRQGGPPTAYYRFSNLPRSAEVLRKLPGFEFENWAVLQLGEVLKHQGHKVFAQTNRSKVGDLGLDGRIYLADKVQRPRSGGDLPLMEATGAATGEKQKYLPIQVKNTDKVGRPEIDKFESALRRDGRPAGFFIGWDFTKDSEKEIERLKRLDDPLIIIPVPVQRLIAEDFNNELLALMRV
jgi:DNA modification methylase